MTQKTNLNDADIQLLKSVFVTKHDITDMERRQNEKYTAKIGLDDLLDLNKKLRFYKIPV